MKDADKELLDITVGDILSDPTASWGGEKRLKLLPFSVNLNPAMRDQLGSETSAFHDPQGFEMRQGGTPAPGSARRKAGTRHAADHLQSSGHAAHHPVSSRYAADHPLSSRYASTPR